MRTLRAGLYASAHRTCERFRPDGDDPSRRTNGRRPSRGQGYALIRASDRVSPFFRVFRFVQNG